MTMAIATKKPLEVKALLDGTEGWQYLDVRTVEEFAAGHPTGAWNAPIFLRGPMGMQPNPEFADVVKRRFDKSSRLVVGCAAGGRSLRACEALVALGFTQLVNVEGGFGGARDDSGRVTVPGWQACGLPVATKAEPDHTWSALRAR